MKEPLYFKQLLAGEDFAIGDAFAGRMLNQSYCIGDAESSEVILVDPAYDVPGILKVLERDNMNIVGVVLTHYHADHAGGVIAGQKIAGTADLLEFVDVPIHVQHEEVQFLKLAAGLSADQLAAHGSGDSVSVGRFDIELLHTPGHTPGSQCLLIGNRLLSGDTLFLDGCGRTDLPGGDASELYYSLTHRLSKLPGDAQLFPGHRYSADFSASLETVRQHNRVFQHATPESWHAEFG